MSGLVLACVALVIALSAGALFARGVKHVKVEEQRWIVNLLLAGAAALAVLALTREPGVLGGILAGIVLALSTVFFGLLALAGQSKQQPAIRVGAPILLRAPRWRRELTDSIYPTSLSRSRERRPWRRASRTSTSNAPM